MAVNNPRSGGTPLAIAKAIANGKATTPTVTPASKSATKVDELYDPRTENNFGFNIAITDRVPLERVKSVYVLYQ